MPDRISVTVIGGYLGSGKTTLVNHLLTEADQRIAVLVNDFGAVNIDADLIESQDGETIRLANGCICCSLAEGFAAALDTVLDLDPRPDRLVIEASGVSDPATVAAYGHGPGLVLDATVVLADAETIRAQAADGYLAQTIEGQLRSADVLVANKVDLIPDEERDDLLQWLTEQNPTALLVTAEHSRIPVELLFGRVPGSVPATPSGAGPSPDDDPAGGGHAAHDHAVGGLDHAAGDHAGHDAHDHAGHDEDHDVDAAGDHAGHAAGDHAGHDDDHDGGVHDVDALFRSWTIERSAPMGRAEAEALVADLPHDVVRAKGLVWLDEHPDQPALLQLVGRRWTLRPIGTWNGPPRTQVVVIARNG